MLAMRLDEGDPAHKLPAMQRRSHPLGLAIRAFAVVFVAYLAGAVVSALAFGSTKASAFFIPGGITVAALLLNPRSRWPAIVAGIVAAEVLVDRHSGLTWPVTAGFALGNVVEAVVGAAVVRTWCGGTPDLRLTGDLSRYVLGAAGVGALFGGGLLSHDRTRLDWVAGSDTPAMAGMDSSGGVRLEEPCIATHAVRSASPVVVSGQTDPEFPSAHCSSATM